MKTNVVTVERSPTPRKIHQSQQINFKKQSNSKNFGDWCDEELFEDKKTETANINFMTIKETSDVRSAN